MDNLISTDIIFANTKQMLKSYEATGMLNDADFFRWTKWVINRIGIGQLIERELVLDVEHYKADLPEDFAMLWVLHKCDSCDNQEGVSTYNWHSPEQRFVLKDWVNKACYGECDACRIDEVVEVTRFYESETRVSIKQNFCNRMLMSLNKRVSKTHCHQHCPNLYNTSIWNFNLDDKQLFFNFCEGHVHLQYYAHALDEDGYPLIVNNEYIKQAIEDYLIFKSFQVIYYNNEVDVQQRLMYAEQKFQQSLKEALNEQKLPKWKKLIEFSQMYPQSLEIFDLKSLADKPVDNSCRYGTNQLHQQHKGY
jgi:hypothetical protein